ncbi:hypothetical protein LTR70_007634 [Exophiala xenobiotica]|uniref:Glycoside hydrolase family 92 protein n=1 Tax=Lithohypha guttulata TaxID=1690604 RepID=A0ABR0K3S4_9EURO|nr:hypothetical protein LTR24_007166 [Lithohypha guttulata]KAK5313448.1 hypothetical protein LTR70_007634 [Exophiala xenobiotica]
MLDFLVVVSLIALAIGQGSGHSSLANVDYSQYVNPLIGSEGPMPGQAFGGGDIFVGGAVPFGVVKVGIDTYETNLTLSTINGGYTPQGLVTGVSMMHESGTGGPPKYGIVHQMPLTAIESPINILDNSTYWQNRSGNDTARVGYFSTNLANGITISLSGARHSGIIQYDYPSNEKHVLVDVSHYLPAYGDPDSQEFLGCEIELQDDGKQYTGYGISFISAQKACDYKDNEITSWNVNHTVQAAVDEWNTDVFSKIRVPLGNAEDETNIILMYSSLYFVHLMPSDRTGENPLWESGEPSWDDFYTCWDVFRNTVSLYHLLQPSYYEGMIRALIDTWRYEGYMPDGRSGNYNGLTQGGSNADNILADAYVKGLKGNINWTAGYQAIVKEGLGALYDWIPLGYLSSDGSAISLSRSVEYALNDFSLYQVAQVGAPVDAQKHRNRSAQWQNNWPHNATSVDTTPIFTGFLAPRLANGVFNLSNYNPALCSECEWSAFSYEATPFEYSFVVPHDLETLINFMGGTANFESRLDYIFMPNTSQQNLDFATPYLYNYINKQYKSVERSRALANQYFVDSDYGVPGNSDASALNSWLIRQMLGIYPIVTQPIYLLESPWFSDINMTINDKATLRIIAHNLDNSNSFYVQSVQINGQPWDKNWFEHTDVLVDGDTIEFYLSSKQTMWETGEVPPSPGHGGKPNLNGTYPMPDTISVR